MPWVLRSLNNRRKWDKDLSIYSWLPDGEIPADPLSDILRPFGDNTLSVWFLENDKEALLRFAIAFGLMRDKFDKLDYILIDLNLLISLQFQFEASAGATPDDLVNAWHRDIVHLSGRRILELTEVMFWKGESQRILGPEIERLAVDAIRSKRLAITKVTNLKMRKKLEELI